MKEKIKKIAILGLCASITLPTAVLAFSNSEILNAKLNYNYTSINKLNFEDLSYLERNDYELSLAQKVFEIIKTNYGDEYPNYYGGIYINDDSTNLIIEVVEKLLPTDLKELSIYNEIISLDSTIKVKYVENSYNDLIKINNAIYDYASYSKNNYKNYSSNYIDEVNNNIVVTLKSATKEEINEFKNKVVNSDVIVFKEGKLESYANIKAGQKITAYGGYCSMGFRTKLNGNAGFVTAAHCTNGLNTSLTYGTVKYYQRGGSGDYAFIQTTSSYTPLNTLAYTGNGVTSLAVVNYCPTIIVGTAVAKAGYYTGYSSGTVKSISYSGTDDAGYYFSGLIATNANANHGDSGGSVFSKSGGVPYGVLMGGNSSDPNATMVFTSINNIAASLQTGRY